MSNKRVRIVNDGQPSYMTKITDAETGKDIPNVIAIAIDLDVKNPVVEAVVTTVMPTVDIIADATIEQVCPCCGRPTGEQAS